MTVAELIKELLELPLETIVLFDNFESVEEVEIVDKKHEEGKVLLRQFTVHDGPEHCYHCVNNKECPWHSEKKYIISERAPGEAIPWEVSKANTLQKAKNFIDYIKAKKKGNFMADRLEYFIREDTS